MTDQYPAFIEEAFVTPIRSVIIVDDDYPTIEEMLHGSDAHVKDGAEFSSPKSWWTNPDPIKQVVDEFRSDEKKYILDIHDAQTLSADEEIEGASHLHQTDLLILDYQLDPGDDENWQRSLKIARELMRNSHFNLVVVNTQQGLDVVFRNYLLGVLSPSMSALTDAEEKRLEAAFDAADSIEDFSNKLESCVGFEQYIRYIDDPKLLRDLAGAGGEYARVSKLLIDGKLDAKHHKILVQSALLEFERKSVEEGLMSPFELGSIQFKSSNDVKWIRSNKAFLTFSSKPEGDASKSESKPLLDCLRQALNDWSPKPSRLLLTKMQAELDECGTEMQDEALSEDHPSALWYADMLNSSDVALKSKVDEIAKRHVDGILAQLMPSLRSFALRLAEAERHDTKEQNREVVKHHYKIDIDDEDIKKKASLEHNVLACTQEPHGWHLQTGHIFGVKNELWVCVSPLCDMVPSQISASQKVLQGNRLRFSALKLHPKKNALPSDVQTNRYVFLKGQEHIEVYSIAADAGSMPDIGVFFAEGAGVFSENMQLVVSRVEQDPATKQLSVLGHETQIAGHLRYEYALNLIHRLGSAVTRVGLDFSG